MIRSGKLGTLFLLCGTLLAVALVAACSTQPTLMTTPALLRGESAEHFDTVAKTHQSNTVEIFYATDRALTEADAEVSYGGERGSAMVLGVAHVQIGKGDLDWRDLLDESLSPERRNALPLSVVEMEEIGRLQESIFFLDPTYGSAEAKAEQAVFTQLIDARLGASRSKDIYVFVSPFKHSFEDSAVVAAEFFHFMGRDGVFMVYSWPTERTNWSYFAATENAYHTVRNLRELIRYLASETSAREIHLMTYSAGARVLSYALHGLRLQSDELDEATVRETFRIGQVIYTGPDVDSGVFRNQYQDGTADLADQITIYTTGKDRALRTARFVFGALRLGSIETKDLTPETLDYLSQEEQTNFVVVSNTERIDSDNSHGYYRESPWVSSDIILLFRCGALPRDRGLVRDEGEALWRFPDDYGQTIATLATRQCPAF